MTRFEKNQTLPEGRLRSKAGQAATEYIFIVLIVLLGAGLLGSATPYFCRPSEEITAEDCKSLPRTFAAVFRNQVSEIALLINLPL